MKISLLTTVSKPGGLPPVAAGKHLCRLNQNRVACRRLRLENAFVGCIKTRIQYFRVKLKHKKATESSLLSEATARGFSEIITIKACKIAQKKIRP